MTPRRPVLRYHGGKWRIAPWVIEHFPPHRVYTEAYGGAASVLLRKPAAAVEVYNDLNRQVVTLFRVLRDPDQAARLVELLRLTPYAYDEWLESMEPISDPVEAARRMIVRSFQSIGTDAVNRRRGAGFRTYIGDSMGRIPAHQWRTFPDALQGAIERLQGVVIENRDALAVLQLYDSPETLHFVDPPYPLSTRNKTPGVYRHEMTDEDHRALAAVVRSLQGMVLISGYACDLYDRELYADWRRVNRETYTVNGAPRTEVLWMNPAVTGASWQQPQLSLTLEDEGQSP